MCKKLLIAMFMVFPALSQAEAELSNAEIVELLEVKIRFATHMAFQPNIIRAVESQNRGDDDDGLPRRVGVDFARQDRR